MSAQSHLILNGLSAGVLLLDSDGGAVFLNPAAEQILGFSQQHGLGRNTLARRIKALKLGAKKN